MEVRGETLACIAAGNQAAPAIINLTISIAILATFLINGGSRKRECTKKLKSESIRNNSPAARIACSIFTDSLLG